MVAAVSIVTFDNLAYASLAPLAYLACGSLEGQVVTPAILGRRLQINTVSVFLAVMFWAWLWGGRRRVDGGADPRGLQGRMRQCRSVGADQRLSQRA